MRFLMIIAALALGFSASQSAAQRPVDITDKLQPTVNAQDDNIVKVHRKHKRYKRYSNKHFRKYHQILRYTYRNPNRYYIYIHPRQKYKRHNSRRYYSHGNVINKPPRLPDGRLLHDQR